MPDHGGVTCLLPIFGPGSTISTKYHYALAAQFPQNTIMPMAAQFSQNTILALAVTIL
jgi:hypothetical protein